MGICMLIGNNATSQNVAPSLTERTVNDPTSKVAKLKKRSQKSSLLWGHGASVGAALGEFQNNFIQGGPATSNSWAAYSIYDGSGSPGNAFWTRSTTGASQGAYWGTRGPITSTTQANGVAIFDSDFMDNAGIPGNFGQGTSVAPHKGELISPSIDLTGYTDSALQVTFVCLWRNFQVTELSVSLSVDGGTTYTDKSIISYLPAAANASNSGYIDVIFPNITAGVANLTNCKLKFTFDGNYYFAMIDDVSISTADPYDLTISKADAAAGTVNGDYESMQIGGNVFSLVNQINSLEQRIGANVKNLGFQQVVPSDNASLSTIIQKNVGGTWSNVHSQTTNIDTVNGGNDNGRAIYANLNNTSWMTEGYYRVIYVTNHSGDNNPSNDSLIQDFSIGSNYLSKVERFGGTGDPFYTRAVFPGGTNFNRFEFGSVFSSPNGGTDNLILDSISYAHYATNNYIGTGTAIFRAYVYDWTDNNSDGVINDKTELTPVAAGADTVSGLTPGTYGVGSVPLFNVISANAGFAMQDNKNYCISISIEGSQFTSTNMPWIAASENRRSYAMNAIGAGGSNPYLSPSQLFVEDGAGVSNSYWAGFGTDMQPSFGVHVSSICDDFTTSLSKTDISCFGLSDGSATVTSSGGVPGHTYVWSTGVPGSFSTVTNLSAGTYTVTITDNGANCVVVDSITVNEPSPITAQLTSLARASCTPGSDGSLTVQALGGIGNKTFNWQTGASSVGPTSHVAGLNPGNYSVTISDANGCSIIENYLVRRDLSSCPSPNLNANAILIQDTSVIFRWDTVAGAIMYRVFWRDANSSPSNWSGNAIKNGQKRRHFATGLQPNTKYFYTLRVAFQNANGIYWSDFTSLNNFTTLSGPCEAPSGLNSSKVSFNAAQINWTSYPNALYYRTRYREAGTSNWNKGKVGVNKSSLPLWNLTPNTSYEWQVKSMCSFTQFLGSRWSPMQSFSTPPAPPGANFRIKSVPADAQNDLLTIFPNPNNGQFNLQFSEEIDEQFELTIMDISGKVIYQKNYSQSNQLIQLETGIDNAGLYLIRLLSPSKQITKRFIVQ